MKLAASRKPLLIHLPTLGITPRLQPLQDWNTLIGHNPFIPMKSLIFVILFIVPACVQAQKISFSVDKLYGDTTYQTDEWALFEKKFMGERIRSLSVTIFKHKSGYAFMLAGYQS